MTEARKLIDKPADRVVFKAAPVRNVPLVWTPHGVFPLGSPTRRGRAMAPAPEGPSGSDPGEPE
jgi:hypothetical protein